MPTVEKEPELEGERLRSIAWHAEPAAAVARQLETDPVAGLDANAAADRLRTFGPNELEHQGGTPWFVVLGRQFWDVLTYILLFAAALSLLVGETVDAVTILAIVGLNALLGFAQEWRAEQALAALRQMLAPACTVVRNQVQQVVATKHLVPGDLVLLDPGDHVPADLRLIMAKHLRVDESTLTGESDS
ncbi:MAG: cation-transporting P-type ATPase, partial [Planctomycetota bacterium]